MFIDRTTTTSSSPAAPAAATRTRHGAPRAAWLAPVLVAALLATGCGGGGGDGGASVSQTSPDATVKTYLNAVADGDGAQACRQLTATMKRDVVEFFSALPELSASSCEEAFDMLADKASGDETDAVRDAEIEDSTVTGSSASVSLKGGSSDVQLSKVGGRWYISGGFLPNAGASE